MFPISVLIFSFIPILSSQLLVSTEGSSLDSQKNVADHITAGEKATEQKLSHPKASHNEFDDDDDFEMGDEEDDIDDDDDEFFDDDEENDLDDDLAFEDDDEDDDDDW
ncbi:MAG: hypothetical protein K2Z81_27180 [Cyanobacteria bacterium]|nr:hypothetical protein [Cyanobacteriota bacterium]